MLNIELDFEVANTEICQELTLMKLELLKDYDINYRPGYRVVLEHNLQSARDFGLKEYKTRKREVEFYDNLEKAINYLKEKAIDYQLKADEEKAKYLKEATAMVLRQYRRVRRIFLNTSFLKAKNWAHLSAMQKLALRLTLIRALTGHAIFFRAPGALKRILKY